MSIYLEIAISVISVHVDFRSRGATNFYIAFIFFAFRKHKSFKWYIDKLENSHINESTINYVLHLI